MSTNGQSKMNFRCQRCRLSLFPHESLLDLKPAQLQLVANAATDNIEPTQEFPQTIKASSWPNQPESTTPQVPWGLSNLPESPQSLLLGKGGPMGSFVVLSDSMIKPNWGAPQQASDATQNTSNTHLGRHGGSNGTKDTGSDIFARSSTLETLFEIISSQTEIDFPVCMECTELLIDGFKKKFEESCKERESYIDFLNSLKAESEPSEKEIEQLTMDIRELELENEESLSSLKEAEEEKRKIEQELADLQKEISDLDADEEQFFKNRNAFDLEISELINEKDRVESIFENESNQLQKLQKVNVHNDVFCIGYDGHFGTINGLRLGRLKDKKVEWSEINAAWGQTLLLLATLINKLNFKLVGYKLRPLGSMSKIDKFELDSKTGQYLKTSSLELYSSGDYSIERLLNHKRLDSAMLAFLAALKQVGDFVEQNDPTLKLPHTISNDKIGGYSIRLSMSTSNENWTTACKYVLTNAKWILAFVSTRS